MSDCHWDLEKSYCRCIHEAVDRVYLFATPEVLWTYHWYHCVESVRDESPKEGSDIGEADALYESCGNVHQTSEGETYCNDVCSTNGTDDVSGVAEEIAGWKGPYGWKNDAEADKFVLFLNFEVGRDEMRDLVHFDDCG